MWQCLLSLKQMIEMKQCLLFIQIFMVTNLNCMYSLAGNLSVDIQLQGKVEHPTAKGSMQLFQHKSSVFNPLQLNQS